MARSERAAPRDGDGRRRFGLLLANALKARGMKQEDLASALGTTQSSVSGWINGKYEPAAATVFAMERALGIDPGYLSRPLGYLPVEGSTAPMTVDAAVAESQLLDEDEKAALLALHDLLVRKHDRAAVPAGGQKAGVGGRVRPGATPGPATRPAVPPRAPTGARGR